MNEGTSQNHVSTVFASLCNFPDPNEKIETKDFLKAAADAVSMIEKFGKAFSPVTRDMKGNIQKLTKKYNEDTHINTYLEEMILNEQSLGEGIATDALLWLRRALYLLSNLFDLILEDSRAESPSNDLAPHLKKAYATSLEPYHGWLGAQIFNVVSRFMPNRRQLIFTLALDTHNQEEIVIRDMQKYNQAMAAVINKLTEFYNNYGFNV